MATIAAAPRFVLLPSPVTALPPPSTTASEQSEAMAAGRQNDDETTRPLRNKQLATEAATMRTTSRVTS